MWIDYTDEIEEPVEELRALEKRRCDERSVADRLKMLRLLKSEQCRSRRQAAEVLGYSERQLGRWFETYRSEGLDGLTAVSAPGGREERVTPEAWEALREEMKAGRVTRLKDAQAFLQEQYSIAYESESGLSRLFKRRGVKLKTGRPRHKDADAEAQAAFKK